MATNYRRVIRDVQLPCTPAEFYLKSPLQKKAILEKLTRKKQSLVRGFRSIAEMDANDSAVKARLTFVYEDQSQKLAYTIPAKKRYYLCDFFFAKKDGGVMLVDVKGEWDAEDREKFLLLKQQFPMADLRMAFCADPAKQWIGKKGGTSYADLCTLGKGNTKAWKEIEIPYTTITKARFLPPEWEAEIIKESTK